MIAAIVRLIGAVGRVSLEEAGRLRNLFLYFFFVPMLVMVVRVISFGSWKITLVFGLFFVVFGGVVLLKLRRLILITLVGEVLDFLGATGGGKPGLANIANATYIRVAYALFVFSMAACFTLPFIPIENFLYFPVLFYAGMLIFFGIIPLNWAGRVLAVGLAVVFVMIVALALFGVSPQARVYFHVNEILGLGLTEKQAQGVSDLDAAALVARDRAIEADIEEVRRWRKDNPNAQTPQYVEKFLSNLKIGKKKTLAEVKKEIESGATSKEESGGNISFPSFKSGSLIFWGLVFLLTICVVILLFKYPKAIWPAVGIAILFCLLAMVGQTGWYMIKSDAGVGSGRIELVNPQAADEVAGQETRINLVPELMTQGGHMETIFLPPCKSRKIVMTETMIVYSKQGNPILHFGANNKGEARVKAGALEETFRGHKVGVSGVVILSEGTVVEFPPDEKPLIWFSKEGGEMSFYLPETIFAYKEMR